MVWCTDPLELPYNPVAGATRAATFGAWQRSRAANSCFWGSPRRLGGSRLASGRQQGFHRRNQLLACFSFGDYRFDSDFPGLLD